MDNHKNLPTKAELMRMAFQMKNTSEGMKLGHCYEALAKQYGFNTYAAMRVEMKACHGSA